MTRTLNGQIRALPSEEGKTVYELSFSSEEPYNRGWCTEILDHSDGCVDLSRLNSIGVMLFNHDRNAVIGKILEARIENGRGIASVEFDDDEKSCEICKKVESGTLKGVSVGYRVSNWEIVEAGKFSTNGKFTGPCDVATRWEPYEVSIVSVPADPTVGVGRELEDTQKREHAPSLAERQLQINLNRR